MADTGAGWIVCQLGAREHYVLAAELHRRGQLLSLCTDTWVVPGSAVSRLVSLAGVQGRQLRERYSPLLSTARVISEPARELMSRRLQYRLGGLSGWDSIIAENEAFGDRCSDRLRRSGLLAGAPVVFAYSYAARRIFESARDFGCMTVLGQIDPGPVESQLVADILRQHGFDDAPSRPPESYWASWRMECELADRIVVNSRWSRDALIDAGIMAEKIRVIPLAYKAPPGVCDRSRTYPATFTRGRPLHLLFLGQVCVRKGVVELLQALFRLGDEPVRLTMVGHVAQGLRERFGNLPNVEWVGPAPRGAVADYYRAADAFILPTHSDGFAITQLEAASHELPLIVSARCGEVIRDSLGGILVDRVESEAIETAIRRALEPGVLGRLSSRVKDGLADFSPERVVDRLVALAEEAP